MINAGPAGAGEDRQPFLCMWLGADYGGWAEVTASTGLTEVIWACQGGSEVLSCGEGVCLGHHVALGHCSVQKIFEWVMKNDFVLICTHSLLFLLRLTSEEATRKTLFILRPSLAIKSRLV